MRVITLSVCVIVWNASIADAKTERFGSVAEAQASAASAVAAIEGAAREVPALVTRQNSEQAKLAELDARAKAIMAERDRALEEAKSGFVCSKCHRTPTQIMADEHVEFEAHLSKVDGQSQQVKATPEDIANIKKGYDAKLADVKRQRDVVARNIREIRTSIDAQYKSAKEAFLFYMAIVPEIDKARARELERTKKRDAAVIGALQQQIKQADDELRALKSKELTNPAVKGDLVAWRDMLKAQMPSAEKARDAHLFKARLEQEQWSKLKQRRAGELRDLLDGLHIPTLSLPPKLFSPGGTPIELEVKGTPVTFSISEYSVGVGVALGGQVSASVSVETDPLGSELHLKGCLEAAGVASACMVRDAYSPTLDLGRPVIEVNGTQIGPTSSGASGDFRGKK